MKPVDQTKFGYPEGNCLMACVASILEVGLDDLPDLFERCCIQRDDGVFWEGGEYWLDVLQEGVEALGWTATWSPPLDVYPTEYAIAGGPAGRAFDEAGKDVGHCVVYFDGVMVHDPHRDKTGLTGLIDDWIILKRVR